MTLDMEFELDVPFDMQFGDWLPASPAGPSIQSSVRISADSDDAEGIRLEAEKRISGTMALQHYSGSFKEGAEYPTILGNVADGEHDNDAATVGQVKAVYDALRSPDSVDYSVYFEIDADGLVSLKPEYRGDTTDVYAENYPFSESDNGPGVEGSKISELPESIVIPDNIDGEEVLGFQMGMFCCNKRVKEITIPKTVKNISGGFVREALHFEKLINTEQLEEIGNAAFQKTRISELICPNLITFGARVFTNDSCLKRVDLGKITGIPVSTFEYCENLAEVKAGEVTVIAKKSFYGTRRLKTIPFQVSVESIGDAAFWNSRCDLEALPDNCTLGDMACYKKFNTTDYWTGVKFTPCKVPLNSLFYQRDPRWVNEEIKYTDKTGKEWLYIIAEDGTPCTYGSNGCAFFVLLEIYSALMDVQFESPEDFFPILEEAGQLGKDFRLPGPWCEIAEGLGFEIEYITTMTAENLEKVYTALAEGALLRKSVAGSYAAGTADGGHVVVGYGINSDGEMLITDTAMHCHEVGIYENHKTAWHIYKHGSKECDCIIVRKPTA